MAAALARPASCGRKVLPNSSLSERRYDRKRSTKNTRRDDLSRLLLPDHPGRQLDDRPCRNGLRAEWPVPDTGGALDYGAVRRADGWRRVGTARSGAAAARSRI